IESIRKKYVGEEECESSVERLKALDRKVKDTAIIVAISVGVISTLVFGLGLTLVLEWSQWIWGIAVAALGCAGLIAAYPLHKYFYEKGKKKYGEEIVRISNELLKK
ncbi:MAG: hypothetical protein IJV80_00520, partial [Clostridia bacterium]|nr:hypothetical protein [Clostridia bacterium]